MGPSIRCNLGDYKVIMHMIYPSRLNITRKFSLLLTYSATMLFGCGAPQMLGITSEDQSYLAQANQDVSHNGVTIVDSVPSEYDHVLAIPGEVGEALVADDVSLLPSSVASVARRTIGIGSVSQSTHQLTTPMTPPTESIHHETTAKSEESMLKSGVLDPVSPLPPTERRQQLSCGQASMLGVGAFSLGGYMTHMLFSNQDTVDLERINLLYNSCLHSLEAVQSASCPALLWGYPAEYIAMAGAGTSGVLLGVLGWKSWAHSKEIKNLKGELQKEKRARLKAEGAAEEASRVARIYRGEDSRK